ncbi:hypothetical protein TNCV_1117331 [Trichonephila clavipes]|nr:hypothetical protein TNCV_1117331 [Trichonephila clavipes]
MWRPRGEPHNPAFALQRHTPPTAGVIVWDAIAYNTQSPLVLIRVSMTAQRGIRTEINAFAGYVGGTQTTWNDIGFPNYYQKSADRAGCRAARKSLRLEASWHATYPQAAIDIQGLQLKECVSRTLKRTN